jgi:glycosyltransferase involved in cell wall biosynthesis
MNVLVWQWGRRGGGPRIAVELAEAMNILPGVRGLLSLSDRAEIMACPSPPACDLPVATYDGMAGFLWRLLQAPVIVLWLRRRLRALRPDLALCAMPGPLDVLMLAALRLRRIPVAVVVHDADPHPGDILPVMLRLQRVIVRRADVVVAMSTHVADRLRAQGSVRQGVPLAVIPHPPRHFGPPPPPPFAHGGALRLLFFGRLLPYKGLDLLADALLLIGPRRGLETRIVGSGPESATLDRLRRCDGVVVENRWVPEDEIGAVIAWSDALVLPYREASQSGAAAAAIAAGRYIVATRVGGLIEQVNDWQLARLCEPDPRSLAVALDGLLAERATPAVGVSRGRPAELSWQDFASVLLEHGVGVVGRDSPGAASIGVAAPRIPSR